MNTISEDHVQMNNEEDSSLISKAKNGDTLAFSQLVHQYQKSLIQVAYGFLRDKEEAKDVVQEVLLKAYRKISHFKNESSLYMWLYQIVINQCKDHLRSKYRKVECSIEDWSTIDQRLEIKTVLENTGYENPRQLAIRKERVTMVREAMDTLAFFNHQTYPRQQSR